ncbi:hypothetical protein [Paenibacillus sp. P46E]|uniref:hypothetical protein n=1 Tax=Paenibacillus sp. P46E TaxID=1349436 RepID=UPI000ADC8805|nr:hypothetical protein [Paenibacillus sp. P46E]
MEELNNLFSHTDYLHSQGRFIQKVLIGAVDNDYSRKVMNEYFEQSEDLIYIDAGIEGVYLPGYIDMVYSRELAQGYGLDRSTCERR